MTDVMRWRYGETSPVVAQVAKDSEVCIGDIVYYWNDVVYPATEICAVMNGVSSSLDSESLARTVEKKFLGVAMQRSSAGDETPIRIATTGVFEFDLDKIDTNENIHLGERIGHAGNFETPLSIEIVPDVVSIWPAFKIGVAAKRQPAHLSTVFVKIISSIMRY